MLRVQTATNACLQDACSRPLPGHAVRNAVDATTRDPQQASTRTRTENEVETRRAAPGPADGAGADRCGMSKPQGSGLYLPKGLPGMPYDAAKAFTFFLRASTPAWPSSSFENVTSFLSGADA